ncbi:hypothetical protein Btru_041074 [Bulinus truncatus]|nr:hypothetical protein Btru_041074 [Bulinus truncatus]
MLLSDDYAERIEVRIILLKGRKIKKRNFLIHLMRSNEKELLVNNMKTHQRLLIVKENSRINFTCKWTGFDVNKISLTRASTGKLLEKTTKLSLRHVVDNFTCTTMDTYICQIQPNRTDNNVASYVTTDVALVNCPPRTCFEKDKNVNLLSTSNVISLCILALDPQQWKPIIVRDTLHISSELEVNHTWQRINKSSLYFNITLFFGSPLPLDNGVHWLSIGDHVLTQLNVTGEIDINNERPFILIVNVCIFALVVLMVLVSILWKKKGSQIFYNLSKRIKWSSMIENVMPFKHIFFRDQLMSSDAATSSRTLQYVNLSQVMGNSHMDVLPQKTSVIGIRCEPGDSLAENDVLKRQTASHLSDEINVNSGVRSGKFNRLNCRSTQVYRSLRKAHKRLKLPQSAHRNVYENIQLLKTMGLDATQCSKAVSRQKTAMQNNEVYANTSHCYGIYNNYPSNEQDFQSNKFSKTTELRISQEKLTGKLQAGRYRSEEGLLYVTLSHDLARKRKSRSRNMKRNKNNSSINDDHVIYAEIDLAKNKRLAILERK